MKNNLFNKTFVFGILIVFFGVSVFPGVGSTSQDIDVKDDVLCGDVNFDGIIDVGDVVYYINRLFIYPFPPIGCEGDVNADDVVNLGDVVYLINYLYRGGPPPIPGCCPSVPSIFSPEDGSVVSGVVDVIIYVHTCYCNGVTKLYIDDQFHSNGTREDDLIKVGPYWVEVFHHTWDTTISYNNGLHELTAYGKHDEYIETITVDVQN